MADAQPVRATTRPALREALRAWVPTPRRNPLALGYLAILLGTTLFAEAGNPGLVRRLQALSSTDVHNLMHHPVVAMVFSAFWAAGSLMSPYLWAVLLTVAPLERRIGALRAAGVFAAGHVLATLVSQLVVVLTVAAGNAGSGMLDELDIGVSYGVLASLGALAGLLSWRGRVVALGAAAVLMAHQFIVDNDLVTGVGHPVALLIGLSCWVWFRRGPRRPARRGSERWPLARPAEA